MKNLHHFGTLTVLATLAALVLSACGAAPAQSWSGVAVSADGSIAYVTGNTHVYALNLNGSDKDRLKWAFPLDNDKNVGPFYADPALAGDLLIVTSFNKSVYAIDANSGDKKWVFPQSKEACPDNGIGALIRLITGSPEPTEDHCPKDRFVAPAAVFGDTVYAASVDNNLYALDLNNGEFKWEFPTQAGLWGAALPTEKVVYVPSMDHNLYAVDAATHDQLWSQPFDGALAGAPALGEGVIYVGALDDTLYALDSATGTERWTVKADGWVWGTPLVVGDTLYFGDLAGSVYSVNIADGQVNWKAALGGSVRATPALSGETLIVPVDDVASGTVFALNIADGSTLWQKVIDERNADRLLANPVISGDAVLIVPMNAEKLVYALNIRNGAEMWTWTFKP